MSRRVPGSEVCGKERVGWEEAREAEVKAGVSWVGNAARFGIGEGGKNRPVGRFQDRRGGDKDEGPLSEE